MLPPKRTGEQRLDNIDVLRGLAALAVTFFHLSRHQFLGPSSAAGAAFQFGYLGVDAFFVISGFIIPWSLYEAKHSLKSVPGFLGRRFLRLYPAYAATCVLVLILWVISSLVPGFSGETPHVGMSQGFAHLILGCDFLKEPWLNPAFWTLAIEAQYYLLVCLALPLLVNEKLPVRIATITVWLSLGLLNLPSTTVFPYNLLFGFGILIFLDEKSLIPRPLGWLLLLFCVLAQGFCHDWPSSFTALLAAAWIRYAKAVTFQPLVWLGTISYALYLVHVPVGGRVINLVERYHPDTTLRLVGFTVACAVAILAAYLFYKAVEKPSHRWARRALQSRNTCQ